MSPVDAVAGPGRHAVWRGPGRGDARRVIRHRAVTLPAEPPAAFRAWPGRVAGRHAMV